MNGTGNIKCLTGRWRLWRGSDGLLTEAPGFRDGTREDVLVGDRPGVVDQILDLGRGRAERRVAGDLLKSLEGCQVLQLFLK